MRGGLTSVRGFPRVDHARGEGEVARFVEGPAPDGGGGRAESYDDASFLFNTHNELDSFSSF